MMTIDRTPFRMNSAASAPAVILRKLASADRRECVPTSSGTLVLTGRSSCVTERRLRLGVWVATIDLTSAGEQGPRCSTEHRRPLSFSAQRRAALEQMRKAARRSVAGGVGQVGAAAVDPDVGSGRSSARPPPIRPLRMLGAVLPDLSTNCKFFKIQQTIISVLTYDYRWGWGMRRATDDEKRPTPHEEGNGAGGYVRAWWRDMLQTQHVTSTVGPVSPA